MLDLEQVQGNVLKSYGPQFGSACYLLLEIPTKWPRVVFAKRVLRHWLQAATFGTPAAEALPDRRLGIAFTCPGLKALGVSAQTCAAFPEEFCEGAWERAAANGDGHQDWHDGFDKAHMLLTIHARSDRDRNQAADDALERARHGLNLVHERRASLFKREDGPNASDNEGGSCNTSLAREHFGFADGCSQPAIQGVDQDPTGNGIYATLPGRASRAVLLVEDLGIKPIRRRWRPISAGEFVLGYENEDGTLPKGPPTPLGPNGTFMVYRVIQQHVEKFTQYAEKEATRLNEATKSDTWDAELVKAKIVGRWPDGTPLTLSPDRPDGTIASNRRRANDFLYRERRDGYQPDEEGLGCPLGAHVRRTNPRDALPGGGERTVRHRIIRRGMPYKQQSAAGDGDGDGDEQGLVFVCYSASISHGFEFIQRQWCNTGEMLGLGRQPDMLLQQGNNPTGMGVPGHDGGTLFLQAPQDAFTTVLGCSYLFVPSKRACEWLAKLV